MTQDEISLMLLEVGVTKSEIATFGHIPLDLKQLELLVDSVTARERERFKKVAEDVLGWVCAGDRQKAFTDADFVGECVRIRLTGLTLLAEIVEPGCWARAVRKFANETAAAIKTKGRQ